VASEGRLRGRGRPSPVSKAAELVKRELLLPAGAKVLVMVSGGQDSVALLHMLSSGVLRQGGSMPLRVLHVNHHLRGEESDSDEALVTEMCSSLGVDATVVHCPVDKRKGNVQEAARDARRAAALEVASQKACERIALGHTADDQVETMFYRLGRYGGLAALAGMKPCDPPWIRPLLSCRREETAAYCREQGLDFAKDRGNTYPGYARTAIRQGVVPAWEAALPGAVEAACRTAEVVAEMQGLADTILSEAAARVKAVGDDAPGGSEGGLSVTTLLSLAPSVRRLLLHGWLEERSRLAASRASVLACEALLKVPGSAERALGGGLRARKEYDHLNLHEGPPVRLRRSDPALLPVPGAVKWGRIVVGAEPAVDFRVPDVTREAYVNADSLDGPLRVRGAEPGDRLRPLGAAGARKLQDIYVDLRIRAAERAQRPLIVCGERIIWVCGLVLAEEAKITRDTTRIWRFSLTALEPGDEETDEKEAATGTRSDGGRS
jgi:tRNA(Ile)-lysidine synthase